jgi:hypothetical protein
MHHHMKHATPSAPSLIILSIYHPCYYRLWLRWRERLWWRRLWEAGGWFWRQVGFGFALTALPKTLHHQRSQLACKCHVLISIVFPDTSPAWPSPCWQCCSVSGLQLAALLRVDLHRCCRGGRGGGFGGRRGGGFGGRRGGGFGGRRGGGRGECLPMLLSVLLSAFISGLL